MIIIRINKIGKLQNTLTMKEEQNLIIVNMNLSGLSTRSLMKGNKGFNLRPTIASSFRRKMEKEIVEVENQLYS